MSPNAATKRAHNISHNGQKTANVLQEFTQEGLWSKVRRILPHREDLIVAGREVKGGIVIHPVIATAILTAIVAIGLSIRSEMNWQHDQLVTLAVQKTESEKRAAHEAEELSKRLQNIDAVQIVLGRDVAKLQESQKPQEKGRN